MMKVIKYQSGINSDSILQRPSKKAEELDAIVSEVFETVKNQGDQALLDYTTAFDKVVLDNLMVSQDEIQNAVENVSDELKAAINVAKNNIYRFHEAQKTARVKIQTTNGVTCWQEKRPIQKVGLYIPGGTAPLFSTVLMLAVPAKIAGCKEIILCSPPDSDGKIADEILYAANLCGVKTIFKVGGIQAIAGLSLGTESIPKVFKIFGPGNQYVTAAKQYATKFGVAIDMPAGPSELLVMADETANPSFVASDLLSQAEHGADSQVILVTTSLNFAERVNEEVFKQLEELPRKEIASLAIENSKIIVVDNFEAALSLIDE